MWSFRNKQQEVKDYYQATAGNNMVMVWLLSAITFVATILVVLGLFWGGRWVYQKITAPDNDQTATTESNSSEQSNQDQNQGSDQGQADQGQTGQNQGGSGSTGAPTPPAPTPTPAPSQPPQNTTPQTGPTELVQTGPSSDE